MAEATQKFVPVQSQAAAPSVGAAPGLPQDTMFQTVYNYAQKQNIKHLQTAREEEYLEGQLTAAQNNGVKEVRETQPWVHQIFGGGAALSGAMDYMESTRLLEYQEDINNNMADYRKMRPEDFKNQQLEKIKQFYTDDDETNQHILRTFGSILPTVVNSQTKAHEGYVQEKHLQSMTDFVHNALQQSEQAQNMGDDADKLRAAQFMDNALIKPVGMNDDSYKAFLYGELQTASKSGDTAVAAKIAEQGLIQTPADRDLLDKAETTLLKYKAEKERFQYGKALSDLAASATDLTGVTDDQYIASTKVLSNTYPMSAAKIAEMLNLRLRAKKNAMSVVNYQNLTETFMAGHPEHIPAKDRQKVYDLVSEQSKQDPATNKQMWQVLTGTDDVVKSIKEGWRTGLSSVISIDPKTGEKGISPLAHDTIQEMKIARNIALDEHSPITFKRHMDQYTSDLFNAYLTAEDSNPGAGEGIWMQTAVEAVDAHRSMVDNTTGKLTVPTELKTSVIDALDSNGIFDEDEFKDQPVLKGAFDAVMNTINLSLPPKVLADRVETALLSRYEQNDDDIWVPKVHGKSVSKRTGIVKPWVALKDYANMTMMDHGVSAVASPKAYKLDGALDQFAVYNTSTHQRIGTVTFDELQEFNHKEVQKKPVITATKQAAYNKIARVSRRRVTNNIEGKIRSGEIEIPASQSLYKADEYAAKLVSEMSDDDVIAYHKNLVDTGQNDTGLGGRLMDMVNNSQSDIVSAFDDFMVNIGDVAIANMAAAYKTQDDAAQAQTVEYAEEYVKALDDSNKEVSVGELTGN